MWVEEFSLENIRCFEKISIRLGTKTQPNKWTTLLSENGGGKSTLLQSLALLLAGPEAATRLLPRPAGWLRDESRAGKLSVRIHKSKHDPGVFGDKKLRTAFGYSLHITGSEKISIRSKIYTEPAVHESVDRTISWLRQNAFAPNTEGWFAVGYGAFRRLTRTSQIIIPTLELPARFTNFVTQFQEDEGLSAFERWMVYLDYRLAKEKDATISRQRELGIQAINELLPTGVRFDCVNRDGKILFDVQGSKVPTISLSDGYRSVLALAGDLVWRLIQAYPNSKNPLHEEGVVLIDELDIHLHPVWQRNIAMWLRTQFPNMQFITTTHSPLVAAGAGDDAITLKMTLDNGVGAISASQDIFSQSVDAILQSEAFGHLSPYAPQTQEKLDRFNMLFAKGHNRKVTEEREFKQLSLFMEEHNPLSLEKLPSSLEKRIDSFLKGKTT